MIQRMHRAYRRRRWMQQAKQLVGNRQGVAARAWSLVQASGDLLRIAMEARPWLADQVAHAATPYRVDQLWVMLALRDEQTQQALWSQNLPAFTRREAPAALDAAIAALHMIPLAEHPTATRLEVYLVSLGDIVHAMLDATAERS